MHLPRSQRRIILLNARLMELEATKALINVEMEDDEGAFQRDEGRIERDVYNNKDHFWFRGSQLNLPLERCDLLDKHGTARRPNQETLKRLDKLVRGLFPDAMFDECPISDTKKGVLSFAKSIGLGPHRRARYLIDREYASRLPTFSAVAQSYADAGKFTERHGGLYFLYRIDRNARTSDDPLGYLVRATLSIRYPVPFTPLDSDMQGHGRVRCKINIPHYDDNKAGAYKYDGYVSNKGRSWWHFLLQSRPEPDRHRDADDLLLLYVDAEAAKSANGAMIPGVMLTQNQDDDLTPTISTAVLVRQPEYAVTEHRIESLTTSDLPDHMKWYYQLECTADPERCDEREFMRTLPRAFRLSEDNLDAPEKEALKALMQGWGRVNLKGLL